CPHHPAPAPVSAFHEQCLLRGIRPNWISHISSSAESVCPAKGSPPSLFSVCPISFYMAIFAVELAVSAKLSSLNDVHGECRDSRWLMPFRSVGQNRPNHFGRMRAPCPLPGGAVHHSPAGGLSRF